MLCGIASNLIVSNDPSKRLSGTMIEANLCAVGGGSAMEGH